MKTKSLKLALLIIFLFNWNTTAHAASGEFTIYPSYSHEGNKSWIIRNAHREETVNESVTLENLTGTAQHLSLSFREASQQNNDFLIYESTDYKNIGKWISLPQSSYTLEPEEKIKVPFEIAIPANTASGKYYGAVFAAKESPTENGVKVITRIGVRIYLDVKPQSYGLTSVLNDPGTRSTIFLAISAIGVIGSVFYNIIIYKENKKNAKK
jgi:uncharacterized membrane protein